MSGMLEAKSHFVLTGETTLKVQMDWYG